jgi:signal transduction histidine kinase
MIALRSLRSRLVLGAVLWTIGLFFVAGFVVTFLMFRWPRTPQVFHGMFEHLPIVILMAVVGIVGGLAAVRRGLAPVNQLRTRLAAVREGRDHRVQGEYPLEVQPLVDDLNALLDHREKTVARALAKAGDLAHGLKTPLAVLAHEAERIEDAGHHDLAVTMTAQVDRMRRQIEYHLAHARAAASGATLGARCSVLESAEGLSRTLLRLHAARGLAIDVCVAPEHVVRGQREDVDEMLGNLFDNACKWARARVEIASSLHDGSVVVTVDDDGPGIAESMRETVLQRGVRADEAEPGFGLGLAIVRDLAELYGGSIVLTESPAGGLRARLQLPASIQNT